MKDLNEWLIFAKAKESILKDASLSNLISQYEYIKNSYLSLRPLNKLLAEVCFLIAVEYKLIQKERAILFAQKAIKIYQLLEIVTLEDAEPILIDLVPDLMHEDVVKRQIIES